jgi:hypothetical protein
MVGAWTGDAIRRPCHASPSSPLGVTPALYALPCRIAGQADSGGQPRETSRYRGPGLFLHLTRGSPVHYRPPNAE